MAIAAAAARVVALDLIAPPCPASVTATLALAFRALPCAVAGAIAAAALLVAARSGVQVAYGVRQASSASLFNTTHLELQCRAITQQHSATSKHDGRTTTTATAKGALALVRRRARSPPSTCGGARRLANYLTCLYGPALGQRAAPRTPLATSLPLRLLAAYHFHSLSSRWPLVRDSSRAAADAVVVAAPCRVGSGFGWCWWWCWCCCCWCCTAWPSRRRIWGVANQGTQNNYNYTHYH